MPFLLIIVFFYILPLELSPKKAAKIYEKYSYEFNLVAKTAVSQEKDIIEGNVWGNREFEFEFSDKYGWRIDLKKYEERYEWII